VYVGYVDNEERGGGVIAYCKAPSPLSYERREGSLVYGLPILSVEGIPLRSRVYVAWRLPQAREAASVPREARVLPTGPRPAAPESRRIIGIF
jgi:hypothetical protein